MTISYRTRQRCKRFFTTVATLTAIALFVWLCWLLWLDRFIVYDRDYGAKLDFSQTPIDGPGEHLSGTVKPTVSLIIRDPDTPDTPTVEAQSSLSGYYIDFEEIKTDLAAVKSKVSALPAGTAVLLDVKHPLGYFYYSSAYGNSYESVIDPGVFDDFLNYLTARDLHLIARLPAFRDRVFGIDHVAHGISYQGGGGALWLDSGGCFWLKPNSDIVQENLINIVKELQSLGFDEVVFTDFCLPDSDKIIFNDDPTEALAQTAQLLVQSCATDSFWVSFTGDAAFPLPQGNTRLYLVNVSAADVQNVADQVLTDDPSKHLLFYTASHDTRFDDYCVLRPLDLAQ